MVLEPKSTSTVHPTTFLLTSAHSSRDSEPIYSGAARTQWRQTCSGARRYNPRQEPSPLFGLTMRGMALAVASCAVAYAAPPSADLVHERRDSVPGGFSTNGPAAGAAPPSLCLPRVPGSIEGRRKPLRDRHPRSEEYGRRRTNPRRERARRAVPRSCTIGYLRAALLLHLRRLRATRSMLPSFLARRTGCLAHRASERETGRPCAPSPRHRKDIGHVRPGVKCAPRSAGPTLLRPAKRRRWSRGQPRRWVQHPGPRLRPYPCARLISGPVQRSRGRRLIAIICWR